MRINERHLFGCFAALLLWSGLPAAASAVEIPAPCKCSLDLPAGDWEEYELTQTHGMQLLLDRYHPQLGIGVTLNAMPWKFEFNREQLDEVEAGIIERLEADGLMVLTREDREFELDGLSAHRFDQVAESVEEVRNVVIVFVANKHAHTLNLVVPETAAGKASLEAVLDSFRFVEPPLQAQAIPNSDSSDGGVDEGSPSYQAGKWMGRILMVFLGIGLTLWAIRKSKTAAG